MKRNTLYTVNKWNRPAFMPEKNLFLFGGQEAQENKIDQLLQSYNRKTGDNLDRDTYLYGTRTKDADGDIVANGNKSWLNISKAANPFSKVNIGKTVGGITTSLAPAVGSFANSAISGGLSSGAGSAISSIGSTVGGAVGAVNPVAGAIVTVGSQVLGGLTNAAFGTKENKENIAAIQKNSANLRAAGNAMTGATTSSDFMNLAGQMGSSTGFESTDLVKGGWFSGGKAKRKAQKYLDAEQSALAMQAYGMMTGAENVDTALDDSIMANFAANGGRIHIKPSHRGRLTELKKRTGKTEAELYNDGNPAHKKMVVFARNARKWKHYDGGPINYFGSGALGIMQNDKYLAAIDNRSDAIASRNAGYNIGAYTGGAKTFADGGGFDAIFMDNFSTDPIGAVVRYSAALEKQAAEKEAAEAQAAREAEYAAMQQRLANLETQNQGLQALMAAQPTQIPEVPLIPETPTYSSPSSATSSARGKNTTWDYIEDQLRKSGKFNDVQIEGIKYNLQRESSIDPTAVGDGGAAFGLAQWHGSRKPKDMSLAGQTQHLIDTLADYDGKQHWIGRGNYEGFMNAKTPEEAHYWIARGYERPAQRIVDKVKRDSDMSLRRLKAFGGELGTNGTDFTNGLLYIDEGGSHESNPFEGVPMGLDPEGIPNLVEEGETVYNDYVFSDRMKVPTFMYKELGIGGSTKKPISFADASKKLAKESEQRPNDPLSQDGLQASLSRLAEVQEAERMKKQAEDYRTGLRQFACGGKKGTKYVGPGSLSQRLNLNKNFSAATPGYFPLTTVQDPNTGVVIVPGINDLATWTAINNLSSDGTKEPETKSTAKKEAKSTFRSSDNNYGRDAENTEEVDEFEPVTNIDDEIMSEYTGLDYPEDATNYGDPRTMYELAAGTYKDPVLQEKDSEAPHKYYPTWMRYAPAFGAGLMTLTDALGLTNKPDYTYADKIEAAAERAGYAPNIQYNPIGDYLRYSPLDRLFYANQLQANARATDRALGNTTSPSRNAALLASGYDATNALGNLYRQAEEYNLAQRKDVADFNRRTNMFNSQMGLEAAMANARYAQQARQMGLSGLAQAAALRDSIDARVDAARSANLNNLLTSLGNIGRENFALNQLYDTRAAHNGYYGNASGRIKRSCGGKMGKRK